MFKRRGLLWAVGLVTLFVVSPFGMGQSPKGDSLVAGIVTDDRNAPVHAAVVGAKDLETGVHTIVLTGTRGEFRIAQLPKGKYEITVKKQGYRPETSQLSLKGGPETLNLKLASFPIVPITQFNNADFSRYLPEAPGKTTLIEKCGTCHSLTTVFSNQGRSREEWDQVVKSMFSRGDYAGSREWQANQRLADIDTGPVIDYLSKYHGPESRLSEELGEKAKKGGHRDELQIGLDMVYREYDVPTPDSRPHTAAPDDRGHVWFSSGRQSQIGRLDLSTGKITEFPLKTAHPHGITTGPDGIVWVPSPPNVLARFDPKTETMEEFKLPDGPTEPNSAIVAQDGKIWITEQDKAGEVLGAITSFDPVTHEFKRYPLGKGHSAYGVIAHGDLIWFTMIRPGKIGFINSKTGEIQTFAVPKRKGVSAESRPRAPRRLRFDAKGRLWFGDWGDHRIGMFEPSSQQFTMYDLPYPSSPYSLYADARPGVKGYVWVASHDRDSLIRFDPDTEEMVEYPLPGLQTQVRDIWPDAEGRLWFNQYGRDKVTSVEPAQVP